MAEAVVDGTSMSRFFCHKCSIEIERLLPDYTCPNCASGFIERLENAEDHDANMEMNSEDFNDIDFDQIYMDLPEMIPSSQLHDSSSEGNTRRDRRRRDVLFNRYGHSRHRRRTMTHENLLQEFLLNLTGVNIQRPMNASRQAPVFFLGNPGDYVWGRDGLDTIVTELLNQLDGSGPPPLSRNQIEEIPTTSIVQSHIDCKLQCSICWEDFILSEFVRQLPCKHLYHAPCIVPWLELHGTCPICRQNLGDESTVDESQDEVGPSLAALFRAANQLSSRSSTSSTAPSNNSTNDSMNEM
ncbi:E3 ubiquitin-protein ligase RNF126-A [Cotesia glomerata]|uniref:E3 ubiquitin-protein ligase RNF126-A n=1 Tax=Cotesia glomerata TaxID=32391 RepID=UPI001D0115FD|nr:E3 ubiquitin-protein ligase RNF126-A [Cotesia glomerata]XP_044575082.1 E3 ubiquitin-protein ligase RNF126-A [Cotesia glomerata]